MDDVVSQFKNLIVFGTRTKNDIDKFILQETVTSSIFLLSKLILLTILSVGIEREYSLLGSEYETVSWVESVYVTVNTFELVAADVVWNLMSFVIPPPPLCL